MNWKRIVGYGVVLWLVPFAVAFPLIVGGISAAMSRSSAPP